MNIIRTEKSDQRNGGADPLGQLAEKNTQSESLPKCSEKFEGLQPTALATVQNDQPVTESQTHQRNMPTESVIHVSEDYDVVHPDPYHYTRLDKQVAAEIRSKTKADPIAWRDDLVRSDLAWNDKRQRMECALQICDTLLDDQFLTILDQNSAWEQEHLSIGETDGLGFRKTDIELLELGKKIKKRAHLTFEERGMLRSDTRSGRWRMQAYVEQYVAVVAAKICPGRIPGRFKWLARCIEPEPYINWDQWHQDMLAEELDEDDEYVPHSGRA
jgi:hypothetical protein